MERYDDMKKQLGVLILALVLLLTACAGKGAFTADDVSRALEKNGLEVEEITLEEAEQLASTGIEINGKAPVPLELTLPTGDMAHREFLLLYVFSSEKERIRIEREDGTPVPIKLKDLYPHLFKKNNLIAVYWSGNKDNPLLMKQITRAMDKL
ncbi:hypothetical protein SAMN05216378_4003 [Paenibacillus catalpae]|uniref:Uncharacterized protein n=2 Tax=Paenibacillus catalpae TaxID=1045775 RepID=A0A1I2D9Q1_9BACL|nr:hypothetical protein SAMN05216378_4003 [Paenibacillus catalpae]